jgi:hypothetical protein
MSFHGCEQGSVKKGRQVVYGKLNMLGGLAINDAADFSRVFGAHSVKGLYDRFIFGYSEKHLKFRPINIKPEFFDTKLVHFPQWAWDAKDEWIGDDLARGRLAEHALRIALVTSSCNGSGANSLSIRVHWSFRKLRIDCGQTGEHRRVVCRVALRQGSNRFMRALVLTLQAQLS